MFLPGAMAICKHLSAKFYMWCKGVVLLNGRVLCTCTCLYNGFIQPLYTFHKLEYTTGNRLPTWTYLQNIGSFWKCCQTVKKESKTQRLSANISCQQFSWYILNNHRSLGLHDFQVEIDFQKIRPILFGWMSSKQEMSLQLWDFQFSACTSSSSSTTSSSASASPPKTRQLVGENVEAFLEVKPPVKRIGIIFYMVHSRHLWV